MSLKQAILDVKTQIGTVPAFAYCAVYNNQVKHEAGGTTFIYPKPAVLVELHNPARGVALLGMGVTINEHLTWRLHIVHEQLDAGGGSMDEDLDVFDLRDALKTAMTGFAPTGCSQLQYVEERQDYDHDSIYVYTISFKCAYVDAEGSPLDADSTLWVDGELTDADVNGFWAWQPGVSYMAFTAGSGTGSAVIYQGIIYLCATANADTTFDVHKWKIVQPWQPGSSYTALPASFVAYGNHIYECSSDNSDSVFTPGNWNKIV